MSGNRRAHDDRVEFEITAANSDDAELIIDEYLAGLLGERFSDATSSWVAREAVHRIGERTPALWFFDVTAVVT